MYVSNHASYLDAVVLLAALPLDVAFVAKRELGQSLLLGPLCRRLGCLFVERHDVREAVEAGRELEANLEAHQSLHIFAEGTFQRDPGLLPFRMGAFVAAANTGAAIVPVVVCGTRAMLPDGALLPRPEPLRVIIGEPVAPADASWQAAIELRRVSRAFILAHVHEPDLDVAARNLSE